MIVLDAIQSKTLARLALIKEGDVFRIAEQARGRDLAAAKPLRQEEALQEWAKILEAHYRKISPSANNAREICRRLDAILH